MCISAFIWQAHPIYSLILLHNRDEYHDRPTTPLIWWEGDQILGGRDNLAGGTWLACSRGGRIAFVTNVREIQKLPNAMSRGALPVNFLESKKDPKAFAEELMKETDNYNGFNLIIADISSRVMVYITNRSKEASYPTMEVVQPGIHVLSNASLDSPWPKAERLRSSFKGLLETYAEVEFPIEEETVEKLMRDTTKDDGINLPNIHTREWEHLLSSIFVKVDTSEGCYGTRSISALSFNVNGEVRFCEKYIDGGSWKVSTETFHIGTGSECRMHE
ncbi:transport and Golgi organization 2 homolog [Impatiens glandulifera]|uniref:transport and Golgi organization 2 homolog n=1 Tax=Impatiens glandulifera TaxID=253017 RepID=UPI001FB13504|nr:transport and Golgi organization 2 homolog [Impatiens glandulifera]